MKKVLKITKGTVITILLILAASVVLGLGGTYAFGQIAQNNAIGSEAAANFAFIDAGVAPEDALVLKNKFDYEDRVFVYEIQFIAGGTNYDYVVRASDGMVLSGEYETVEGYRAATGDTRERARAEAALEKSRQDAANAALEKSRQNAAGGASAATPVADNTPSVIGVSEAKQIALREAGLTEQDGVVFTAAKLEDDEARLMYEIKFYLSNTEYEVDVDAAKGTVLSYNTEAKEPVKTPAQSTKPAQATQQTPQVTTPVQTTPQVTTPVQQAPQATAPVQQTPQVTTPVQTTPQVTTPVQQAPQVTVPTVPVQTTPQVTIPVQQTPDYDDDDDDDYDDDDHHYQAPASTPSAPSPGYNHQDYDDDDDDD